MQCLTELSCNIKMLISHLILNYLIVGSKIKDLRSKIPKNPNRQSENRKLFFTINKHEMNFIPNNHEL